MSSTLTRDTGRLVTLNSVGSTVPTVLRLGRAADGKLRPHVELEGVEISDAVVQKGLAICTSANAKPLAFPASAAWLYGAALTALT